MDNIKMSWNNKSGTTTSTITLQEEIKNLYDKICMMLPRNHLFDDSFENAFQALSEIVEYHGGGGHFDYL